MPVNQGHGAPAHQQRTVELENVGPTDIPAYGVVEIVDSYRPEKSGVYTPDAGITVYKVQRPTTDNPCAFILNQHCPISVGERHRVGTNDYPAYALMGDSPNVGEIRGIKKDSYKLWKGLCGFVVTGDYDGTKARVHRWDECPELMVRATECHKVGLYGMAQPQKWDDTSCDWVDDTDRSEIRIEDPMCWRLALKDEKFKVQNGGCGSQCDYIPSMPFGLTRRVKVKTKIECNSQGTVTIQKTSRSCPWGDSDCEVYACNTSNRQIACDAEETATLHYSPGECIGWLVPDTRPQYAQATLSSAMCGSDASISSVTFEDVCQWSPRTTPTTAQNPLGLYGCVGDTVSLVWNDKDCKWDVANVEVHWFSEGPVVEFKCSTSCGITKKKIKGGFATQQCSDCDTVDTTSFPVTTVTVLTGLSKSCTASGSGLSSCSLVGSTAQVCVFGCATPSTSTSVLSLSVQEVVTEAVLSLDATDGVCLDKTYKDVCVICTGSGTATDQDCIDTTDC